MGLFKTSNTEKAVQRDISASRERLLARLADTEQAIARHAAAAKQAALTGNEAELDRAEVSLRAAQDRSKTLKAALADVEQALTALERSQAEIAERKVRAQTAAEIELVVRKMTEAATEFDAAAARLSEFTTQAVPWLWEVRGLDEFITIGRAQVPPAVELVGQMLRAYANDVIAGKAPATLPRSEESSSNDNHHQPDTEAANAILAEANLQPLDRGVPERKIAIEVART
jgi:malonyl CoA-acyl carrier protein transacylase